MNLEDERDLGLHRGAVNRFHWMWQVYPFEPGEVCCQKTSLSFVDAVWDQVNTIRKLDVAILIVEQNTRRTLTNADWAYVMTLGRNRLSGTGKDLLDDPEIVELYIGKEA